jgi:hypothetical protein
MNLRKLMAAVIACGLLATGCDYIVPPIGDVTPTPGAADNGWAGIVNKVADANGALHVDLSIVNDTGDWSAMDIASSTAKLTDSQGKSRDCETVFVGTSVFVNDGGTYLPTGFVMKGYTGGTQAAPKTQLLYVECKGASASGGGKLAINYTYITGAFNYYVPSKEKTAVMNLDLGKVVADTKYPVADAAKVLSVAKVGEAMTGINGCAVKLVAAKRTDTGLELDWDSANPTQYPAYIHIGNPPVIGTDGIVYGVYQSPHLAIVPVTPSLGDAQWTTKVTAPKDISGYYVLVPLETQQQKYFVDHLIDIRSI